MAYKLPKEVINVLDKFQSASYQIYIVGGAVRDLLMGREVKDWDFTTDAKPEEILKLFPKGFYDNKFGTVGIPVKHLPGEKNRHLEGVVFEITTMRKEGEYKDFRHPDTVGWTNKIEEDLARRDFTINAVALSVIPSASEESQDLKFRDLSLFTRDDKLKIRFVDPFNGQQDIKDNLIRAVGNPNQRFKEDALRLMRAIRISAELEFDIEKDTLEAIKRNSKLIENIAWERIRDELFKLLVSPNPHSTGHSTLRDEPSGSDSKSSGQAYMGILKLREAGILQIILPELERCFGVSQEGPKHARVYDIGEHSLLTLKHTPSKDPITLLAALLHDVGKPETVKVSEDGNVTFYNHDLVGGQIVLKIAKRFNLSNKQTDKLFRLVRWHLFTVDERQTDSAIRRFIKNVGVENIDDMMALRIGDRLGGGTQKAVSWRMEKFRERIAEVSKQPFSIKDLKVNGNDVMEVLKIKPSRIVGEVLNKLFDEVVQDISKNNRAYLLKQIKEYS